MKKIDSILRKSEYLTKLKHSLVYASFKKPIPIEKLNKARNVTKLNNRDKVYLLIEGKKDTLSKLQFYLIISDKGIAIYPEDPDYFVNWNEIEEVKFKLDNQGNWMVFHINKEKYWHKSYNVFLFKGIPDKVWINIVQLLNEIVKVTSRK